MKRSSSRSLIFLYQSQINCFSVKHFGHSIFFLLWASKVAVFILALYPACKQVHMSRWSQLYAILVKLIWLLLNHLFNFICAKFCRYFDAAFYSNVELKKQNEILDRIDLITLFGENNISGFSDRWFLHSMKMSEYFYSGNIGYPSQSFWIWAFEVYALYL